MNNDQELTIRKLSKRTLFKILLIGLCGGIMPLCVLMGILSLFGANTVEVNGHYLTGLTGFIAAPIIGLFVGVLLSAISWVFSCIGLWIYSLYSSLTICYKPED